MMFSNCFPLFRIFREKFQGGDLDVFNVFFPTVSGQFVGQMFGKVVVRILGQVFDHTFGQGYDQVRSNKYSAQYCPALRENRQKQQKAYKNLQPLPLKTF